MARANQRSPNGCCGRRSNRCGSSSVLRSTERAPAIDFVECPQGSTGARPPRRFPYRFYIICSMSRLTDSNRFCTWNWIADCPHGPRRARHTSRGGPPPSGKSCCGISNLSALQRAESRKLLIPSITYWDRYRLRICSAKGNSAEGGERSILLTRQT